MTLVHTFEWDWSIRSIIPGARSLSGCDCQYTLLKSGIYWQKNLFRMALPTFELVLEDDLDMFVGAHSDETRQPCLLAITPAFFRMAFPTFELVLEND